MYNSFIYGQDFDKELNTFRKVSNRYDVIDLVINGVEWVLAKDERAGKVIGQKEGVHYFVYTTLGYETYEGFLVTYTFSNGTVTFLNLRERNKSIGEDSAF